MLRSLGQERWLTLLANWHRGVHGKFKVPMFAHRELDLFTVFWAVMDKGGYGVVSAKKQWKVGALLTPKHLSYFVTVTASSGMLCAFFWCVEQIRSRAFGAKP